MNFNSQCMTSNTEKLLVLEHLASEIKIPFLLRLVFVEQLKRLINNQQLYWESMTRQSYCEYTNEMMASRLGTGSQHITSMPSDYHQAKKLIILDKFHQHLKWLLYIYIHVYYIKHLDLPRTLGEMDGKSNCSAINGGGGFKTNWYGHHDGGVVGLGEQTNLVQMN